ncbi:hypothetical protein N7455_001613 [Penicillium solitum]|uniref:uncharacterized protein n=1 Tax=Penicillium solitum TaxID=60172 RepID=UPI001838CAC9|nr:hypothetical protein HAV15_007823 [Penicillium sp. str. \
MSYDTKGVVKKALPKYPSKYLSGLTFSSPRTWLSRLLQSVVVWVDDAEATQAAETEKRLRAQVTGLGQQIRGTEGQVHNSVGRLPTTKSYADPCGSIEAPAPAKDRRYRAGTWQP